MLVQVLFDLLDGNWALVRQNAHGSPENFRWRKPKPNYCKRNTSLETMLEKELIKALEASGNTEWSNQVPLISGIAGTAKPHAFKKMSVDLVRRQGESCFEFVELKVESNTPVFAAVEILVYGLLWLLSRRDRQCLGYAADNPILNAKSLKLSVLAPQSFYSSRYSIDPLADAINNTNPHIE
jgi:hypothetical protein